MPVQLTLETRLILACARADPDLKIIRNLLEIGPDWKMVLRQTEDFGLAPWLYANLRAETVSERVPESVAQQLKHLYRRDAIRSISLRQALRRILLRFSEASVPVMVLKGAALATSVYPSPAFRTMGDIDLLVHRCDLEKVDDLFQSMDYQSASPVSLGSGSRDRNTRYIRATEFPAVEIHTGIFISRMDKSGRRVPVSVPVEELWTRSQPILIEHVPALTLGCEDLLLHLAVDFAAHLFKADEFTGHVRTLCDIREVCRRHASAVDWNRLVAQARTYKIAKYLYYCLLLATDLVDAGVRSNALSALKTGSTQLPHEDKLITAAIGQAIFKEEPPVSGFSYNLGLYLFAAPDLLNAFTGSFHLLTRLMRRKMVLSKVIQAPNSRNSRTPSIRLSTGNGHIQAGRGELAVTYDQSATDGLGAQLQRIYGLYAMSRALHIKYVHTPLGRVHYQGFLPFLAGRNDPNFAAQYNAFFSLPSDDFDLDHCERIHAKDHLDRETVEQYREYAVSTGRQVLLEALSGYGYTDRHPAAYHALRAVTPYRGYQPSGPVRVCVHVRRADNNAPDRPDRNNRWLPNAYYLHACNAVIDALREQGASFLVRLHTEIPPRPYTLHPGTAGLYFKLDQPATIDPADYAMEDFEALPNLQTILNVEPQQALDDFATADVLILSLSSFSYLGGLLNPHGLIVYAPWWHPALPDWLTATRDGDLDRLQLTGRIREHLQRRAGC